MLPEVSPETERILRENKDFLLQTFEGKGWEAYGKEIDRLLPEAPSQDVMILKNLARMMEAHKNGKVVEEYARMFPKYPSGTSPELAKLLDRFRAGFQTRKPTKAATPCYTRAFGPGMFFSIKDLEVKKIEFDQDFPPGEITFTDSALKQLKPLHAEGVVELLPHTDGEVRIQGRITTEIGAECDRCLGDLQIPIDAPINLFYRPASALTGDADEEVEIDEGEAEIAFYEGKGIELEQVIAEQILLLLPMQLVCQEACKGICPVCGGNRNQTDCECQAVPADERWSALKGLVP